MDIRSTRIFKFWERYEHHLGLGALAAGFFFDLIIADRPDSLGNNLLLLFYIFVAGAIIIILNLQKARRAEHDFEPLFLLLALQFAFGGLASNLLVLYGRSGTLVGSALFLTMLVALVIGNEYLRNRYSVLKFNVGVYYFLLLSYCVIAVPTFITHSIGTWEFLLSGVISLVAIGIFLGILFTIVFHGRERPMREVSYIVGSIFIVFNLLYFLNVIPPVPLSMKNIGIYHSLLKQSSGDYIALYEKVPWYEFWRDTASSYTLSTGNSVFCYSSVFAPANLETPIFHRWEKYNDEAKVWETQSRISFSISGGRDEGYRGYSQKSALSTGKWRCNVETENGSLIGRTAFKVINGPAPELSQKQL